MTGYDPEVYWSRVAQEIRKRGDNYIAGDDNPYFRYKRRKFLKDFLDTINFQSKSVLEVGSGPGGNLKHLATYSAPKKIFGADVSKTMLEIATENLRGLPVTLVKTDGASLPFPDQYCRYQFYCYGIAAQHGRHNVKEVGKRTLPSNQDYGCGHGRHRKRPNALWRLGWTTS